MTTLEIKRLDSVRTRSTSGIDTNGVSSPPFHQLSTTRAPNRNSLQLKSSTSPITINLNRVTNDNKNDNENEKSFNEIPINIIKSPSYTNQNNFQQSNSLVSQKSSTDINTSTSMNSSSNNNNNNINNNNTSSSSHDRSSLQLNQSDQIADINTDTLRFNKYGFIQGNKTEELYDKSQTLPANGTKSNNNSNNKNNLSTPSSTLNRNSEKNNQQQQDNMSFNSANSQVNITNLKDYLQNTDVEEFAEQIPIKVIQQRELKWVEMLKNFDEWMDKRFKKIKSRCRKGIPQSMRSKAWMHLTGAVILKRNRPNYYNECLTNPNKVDVAKYIEDIKKDLHRQFPSHEIFMKKEGRQMLFNVLKAYAVHNREVGYCQAQGPIAALLLMHMPEEDAFWMLIRISDYYLKEYYKPGLEKVQIDGHALFYLFKKENSTAYKLMVSQGIDPILYMTEWFMCIYARTLPWCTVLRVWDMFFCEGVKVLYRVGLYLMLSAFNDKQKFQRCQQQGMYETLNCLKNLPIPSLKEADLVRDSTLIKVNENELKKAFDKSKQEFIRERSEMMSNRKQPPPQSSYINTNKKK